MAKSTFCRCETTTWTRARRCLCLWMLFLTVGTFMLTVYVPSLNPSWFMTMKHTAYNTLNTSAAGLSPDDTSLYFVPYPNQYSITVDEPHRCWQERPFLVLIIPVAPINREARNAIRNTWGKETTVLGRVVSRYFLLGMSKEEDGTESINEQVLEESRTHHDILQSDFLDSYNNLTIKTMVMFEWLGSRCPNASFAMKIDSDMFLNVRNLVSMLLKAPQHLYMTGMVVRGAPVLRDRTSKWFLPVSVYPEYYYPTYARGLGYVFSLDLPKRILEASAHVKAIYIEDVYVGLCMRRLGIALANPPRGHSFHGTVPNWTSNCYWTSVITTILRSSDQLKRAWREYQSHDDCAHV